MGIDADCTALPLHTWVRGWVIVRHRSAPRRNRIDPWSDLHSTDDRGLFTGNRGCLVDDDGTIVRHHRGALWICCQLRYRGWRHPLDAPRVWTPLFFLDDAVALAAGHRPCGLCRRDDYESYRQSVSTSVGSHLSAQELDARLASERLGRGRGLDRRSDRVLWQAEIDALPAGTVVGDDLDDRAATWLVGTTTEHRFTFGGWADANPRRTNRLVTVVTPPTSVAALANGFVPTLHPSGRL